MTFQHFNWNKTLRFKKKKKERDKKSSAMMSAGFASPRRLDYSHADVSELNRRVVQLVSASDKHPRPCPPTSVHEFRNGLRLSRSKLTTSVFVILASRSVRLSPHCDWSAESSCRPQIAAPTLPVAIMDGGYMANVKSVWEGDKVGL